MSKHTQEPWFHHKPAGSQHTSGGYINNSASRNIDAICHVYGGDTGLANAARIVTCVNACAGMEDPAAEIDELKRQRDELLAALRSSVETIEWMHGCSSPASDEVEEATREGNAAIAKAEAVQA